MRERCKKKRNRQYSALSQFLFWLPHSTAGISLAKGTVLSCTETIPPGPEMASDEIEDRKKALRLSGRFETPQLLFMQSCEDCQVIYEEDR